MLGWRLETLRSLEGVALEAAKRGVDPTSDETLKQIQTQRSKIVAYAKVQGFKTDRSFPGEKLMAERYGREAAFVDYRYAHHIVHGSPAGLAVRVRERDSGEIEIGAQGDDEDYLESIAGFASDSAMHARFAASKIFDWPEPEGLRDLLEAFERERARASDAS